MYTNWCIVSDEQIPKWLLFSILNGQLLRTGQEIIAEVVLANLSWPPET